jgi:hypothetical protein
MEKNSEKAGEKPGKTGKGWLPLECRLTEDEVREAGKQLAEALNQKEAAESKRAAFLTQIKSYVAVLESMVLKNQSLVLQEKEVRNVECEVRYFFSRNGGEKEWCRLDTGEIVKVEPVTDEERQRSLI